MALVCSSDVGIKYTKDKLNEFSNYNCLNHTCNLEFMSVVKLYDIFRSCCSCRVSYLDCYISIKFKNLEFSQFKNLYNTEILKYIRRKFRVSAVNIHILKYIILLS